jgi:hypothetical protein
MRGLAAAAAAAVLGGLAPQPLPAAAASDPALLVAPAANLAEASPLAGAQVSGTRYVALPTVTGSLGYLLDGSATALATVARRPDRFAHTRVAQRVAVLDAAALAAGSHVLRAVPARATADGTAPVLATATFTVVNASTPVRPFAASSPWNVPVPAAPVLDPRTGIVVAHLASRPAIADLYEYGFPVYTASISTPRYPVDCTKPWGTCGLERQPVPVPLGARPSTGTDAAMVVIDPGTGQEFDFWQARRTSTGGWGASWGAVSDLAGDGRTDGATGPGLPVLGGLVRTAEITNGVIDHALAFSTDAACRSVFRYPAWKTDGASTRTDCVPEGARLQLDPSINVKAIPGITPAEVAVARAMQVYGAYVRDNGGATMAFGFESPTTGVDPYPAAGLRWDYAAMPHVPWQRMRLLRSWDGR